MTASSLPTTRLRKDLGLLDVYAVALGTTLSAGFFLLPGLAIQEAGPAIVLAYVVAAIPLVPAMLSIVELATAMPRAGGAYYFLDRTLGPVVGVIGGFGTWLALLLKTSFALIGAGAYLGVLLPDAPIVPIAVAAALALGLLNVWSTGKVGSLQVVLVVTLLAILATFIGVGLPQVELARFEGTFAVPPAVILGTSGLVYVSYVGITKVASLAEEVKDPERSLPLGVFLALATAALIYGLGTFVMVGTVPLEQLAGNLTPAARAGESVLGRSGQLLIAVAALIASVSVASAGILSASRYPLAMARDHSLPAWFRSVSSRGTPVRAIAATVGCIVAVVVLLDPLHIAELAGAFQLILFVLLNLSVIVMRESGLASYDPGYRAPFYPWLQIFGMLAPLALIASMGTGPALFAVLLVAVSVSWYFAYARDRVARVGAIYHVFERLGQRRFENLETELRGILKEKGLRTGDPFDDVVMRAQVIDVAGGTSFESLVSQASRRLAAEVGAEPGRLESQFLEGTRVGATPVERGVAIPHLRIGGIEVATLLLARSRAGVSIQPGGLLQQDHEAERSRAIFFLISPDHDASQHLRFLAQIAVRVEEEGFMEAWMGAADAPTLREILLQSERSFSLTLRRDAPSAAWIEQPLQAVGVPDGCLVAMIRRAGETLVPGGNTLLLEGDRLTLIGGAAQIRSLRERFREGSPAP